MNKFFTQERIDGLRALSLKPKMVFQAQTKEQMRLFQIIDMNWMSFYSELDQRLLSLKIFQKQQDFYITVIDSNNNVSLEVKIHAFVNLQVTKDQNIQDLTRISFQNDRGNVFGLEIRSSLSDFSDIS